MEIQSKPRMTSLWQWPRRSTKGDVGSHAFGVLILDLIMVIERDAA